MVALQITATLLLCLLYFITNHQLFVHAELHPNTSTPSPLPSPTSPFAQQTSHFYFSPLYDSKVSFSGHFLCLQSEHDSTTPNTPQTASNPGSSITNICSKLNALHIHLISTAHPYKLDSITWTVATLPGNIKLAGRIPDFSEVIDGTSLDFTFPDHDLPKGITGIIIEGFITIQSTPAIGVNPSVYQLGLDVSAEAGEPTILTADFVIDKVVPADFPFHLGHTLVMGKQSSAPSAPHPSSSLSNSSKQLADPPTAPTDFLFHFYLFSLHNPNNLVLSSVNLNLIGQFSFHPLTQTSVCSINGLKLAHLKLSTQTPPSIPTDQSTGQIRINPQQQQQYQQYQHQQHAESSKSAKAFANILTIDLSTVTPHFLASTFAHSSPVSIICENIHFSSTIPITPTIPPDPLILSPFIVSTSVDFYHKASETSMVLVDSISHVRNGIVEFAPHPRIALNTQYLFNSIQFTTLVDFATPFSTQIPTNFSNLDVLAMMWQGVILEQFTIQRQVYAPSLPNYDSSLIYEDSIDTPLQTDYRYLSELNFSKIFPPTKDDDDDDDGNDNDNDNDSQASPTEDVHMNNQFNPFPPPTDHHNAASPPPHEPLFLTPSSTTPPTVPSSFITSMTIRASQVNLPASPRSVSIISQLITARLDDPERTQDRISHFGTTQFVQPFAIPLRQPPVISFKAPGLNLILPGVIFPQSVKHSGFVLDLSFPRSSAVFTGNFTHCSLSKLVERRSLLESIAEPGNTGIANRHGETAPISADPIYPPFDSDEWVYLSELSGYDVELTQKKGKLHVAAGNQMNIVRFMVLPSTYVPPAALPGPSTPGTAGDFVIAPFDTLYLNCHHAHVHTNWERHPKTEVMSLSFVQIDSESTEFRKSPLYTIFALIDEYQFNGPSHDAAITFTHRGTSLSFSFTDSDDDDGGDDAEEKNTKIRAIIIVVCVVGGFLVVLGVGYFMKQQIQKGKNSPKAKSPDDQFNTQMYDSSTASQRKYGTYDQHIAYEPLFE